MALKIKVKATGKEASQMAKDPRIEAAFHEVMHNTPKAVKHTARTEGAEQAHKQQIAIALSKARRAGASIPGASGSNYVSRDDLHVEPGRKGGVGSKGASTVPYRAAPSEGKREGTGLQGTEAELGTGNGLSDSGSATGSTTILIGNSKAQLAGPEGPGPSYDGGTMNAVRTVRRALNPVELVRRQNNAARDARTNLGRGKAGVPVIEEDNNVSRSW